LDAVNAKRGWKPGGYDEAYLKEVRNQEAQLEKDRRKEERELERERRKAEREAQREERRRLEELQREREEQAERQRLKEEERERRREEKKRLKRLERDQQRKAEVEREDELTREQELELERERAKQIRKEREREKARRQQEEQHDHGHEYTSSEDTKERAHKDEWKRRTKYREVGQDSPNVRNQETTRSHRKSRRVVSGPYLEDGGSDEVYEYREEKLKQGDSTGTSDFTSDSEWKSKRNKRICRSLLIPNMSAC
jgi:hypothetical protein